MAADKPRPLLQNSLFLVILGIQIKYSVGDGSQLIAYGYSVS